MNHYKPRIRVLWVSKVQKRLLTTKQVISEIKREHELIRLCVPYQPIPRTTLHAGMLSRFNPARRWGLNTRTTMVQGPTGKEFSRSLQNKDDITMYLGQKRKQWQANKNRMMGIRIKRED